MKNKLAIFDLDGTLFDTRDVNYFAYKEALSEYGFDLERDYYCKECNGKFYKVFLPPISTNDDEILEKIHKLKKNAYIKHLSSAKMNVHLFNIMHAIKNEYYLAVVTTASKKNCMDILTHFEVEPLFDLIITHDDITKVKPDPEGFNKAMHVLNIKPEQTMIFEDSKEGIAAARASGANVFSVNEF
jgi:beta-phosphoglucomutase